MNSVCKTIKQAIFSAAPQSLMLFVLTVVIPTAQGAEELYGANKLILEQLPSPRFANQSPRPQCTNSKWRFTDKTAANIWQNILDLNDTDSYDTGPLLLIWVRGYFPAKLAFVPKKYNGDPATCVDADFITRAWQTSINTPVSGVLSKDDAMPLIRVMDMVNGTNYGGHLETDKPANTTTEVTGFRLGMTLDELRPRLQSWCRPGKSDPNFIVCNSSEQPCLKFNNDIQEISSDIKKLNARINFVNKRIPTIDPRQRFAQQDLNQLKTQQYYDTNMLARKQKELDGLQNRQKQCEYLQAKGPKYTVEDLPVYALAFYFSSGGLTSIFFRLEDYNRGIEALDARYGKPSLRVEKIAKVNSQTNWEFNYCEHLDGNGKCIAGNEPVTTNNYYSVNQSLRTWKFGNLKIVEQPEHDFHLIPADGQ